jgi:Rrf2 family nitric oxide-sensitive transcriptional repressor
MFSQTAEYALRAIVYLADQGDSPRTTQQIAVVTHVPPGYLAKVMQSLSRAGLVSSQRGLYGGFVLAQSAKTLTVLDVVQAIDPLRRIESCPLGLEGHLSLCPLHRRLDSAVVMVEKALRESTIAELLAESAKGKNVPRPLCSMSCS